MMLPGDVYPGIIRRRPWITYFLIIINSIIYLLTSYKSSFLQIDSDVLWRYSFVPALLSTSDGWLRILTSMFLHGYPLHIIFNMYFLYIFGRDVETFLGSFRYFVLYIASGFLAAFVHTSMSLVMGIDNLGIPALGASGAISGVLGAFLMLFPGVRMSICIFIPFPICGNMSSTLFIIFWFILQIIYGYLQLGGVAFFAHVGGFLGGLALVYYLGRDVAHQIFGYKYFNISFNSVYSFFGYRRGLSPIARFILIFSAALILLSLFTAFSLIRENPIVNTLYIKASVTTSSEAYRSSEAVVVIFEEANRSRSTVAPIADDVVRVLFNRLYSAGYIINTTLAGYQGSLYFSGSIRLIGLIAPPVRLIMNMTEAVYTDKGMIKEGVGNALTDLLTCDVYGRCSITDYWYYKYFSIKLINSSPLYDIIMISMIPTIISLLVVIYILIARKDLEISYISSESI